MTNPKIKELLAVLDLPEDIQETSLCVLAKERQNCSAKDNWYLFVNGFISLADLASRLWQEIPSEHWSNLEEAMELVHQRMDKIRLFANTRIGSRAYFLFIASEIERIIAALIAEELAKEKDAKAHKA